MFLTGITIVFYFHKTRREDFDEYLGLCVSILKINKAFFYANFFDTSKSYRLKTWSR